MGSCPFWRTVPVCIVAMEACATAHGRGRKIVKLGHEVRPIPTQYVTPYVKRQKNDMADAEAIAQAESRPITRFMTVKNEESQARAVLFRTRHKFVHQRTRTIKAARDHLVEHGAFVPPNRTGIKRPAAIPGDDGVQLSDIIGDTARVYRVFLSRSRHWTAASVTWTNGSRRLPGPLIGRGVFRPCRRWDSC